jgi:DNA-binding XRE family transcriptional regulator
METKRVKRFVYEGLGFPVVLLNVSLTKKRGVWTPAIDYNKLQKAVVLAMAHKPVALTGHEVHFIRTYFEMTLQNFGKRFGVTHVAVLAWEKKGDKPAKINPTTELCIRLFILEKLNMSNVIFREAFREFDIEGIAKASKTASLKDTRPLTLPGVNVSKRSHAHA